MKIVNVWDKGSWHGTHGAKTCSSLKLDRPRNNYNSPFTLTTFASPVDKHKYLYAELDGDRLSFSADHGACSAGITP